MFILDLFGLSLDTELSKSQIYQKDYVLLLYEKEKLAISIYINTQILFSSSYPIYFLTQQIKPYTRLLIQNFITLFSHNFILKLKVLEVTIELNSS